MKELLSLGELYVSNFIKDGEEPGRKHELKLVWDEKIGAARLETTAPLNSMFGKYWYRSGTNLSMKTALADIVYSIIQVMKLEPGDTWLDIASNDGTLLSMVPDFMTRIGIDPCEDSIKQQAEKHADRIIQDYFKAGMIDEKPKVITSIAMFYDLEDPIAFTQDVYDTLHDEGLWVLQLSYTPLMVQQLAFDNILSEHVYYHDLHSVGEILGRVGFDIVDCQLNDVNGGSFRVYARKLKANPRNFGTQPFRDVAEFRVKSVWAAESGWVNALDRWEGFYGEIVALREQVVSFIKKEVASGKVVMGYGASTKGNTLLQFFGLDNSLITAIAERSPYKYGLKTVGTNIPIISEEEMRKAKPDYLFVLPWHFISEFADRESEYMKSGGKMIVPLPKFEVI